MESITSDKIWPGKLNEEYWITIPAEVVYQIPGIYIPERRYKLYKLYIPAGIERYQSLSKYHMQECTSSFLLHSGYHDICLYHLFPIKFPRIAIMILTTEVQVVDYKGKSIVPHLVNQPVLDSCFRYIFYH